MIMLQKLEDLWTNKDWQLFQGNPNRPVFGPLRGVGECDEYSKESSVGKSEVYSENTENEDTSIPGWYNIQQWTDKWEQDFEIPDYTGMCIPNSDYEDHLALRCKTRNIATVNKTNKKVNYKKTLTQNRHLRSPFKIQNENTKADIKAEIKEDSYSQLYTKKHHFRYPIRTQSHNKKTDIEAEIEKEIAFLANDGSHCDSVPLSSEIFAQTRDNSKWKDRKPCTNKSNVSGVLTTHTVFIDNSEVNVNVFDENTNFGISPTSDIKTPPNTPTSPPQQQKVFNQITYSSRTLLQRILEKLNFLSAKQKTEPWEPLFKTKCISNVNFCSFWDFGIQNFVVHRIYESSKSNSKNNSSSCYPSVKIHDTRERSSRSENPVNRICRRKLAGSGNLNQQQSPNGHKMADSKTDLFSFPLFIPTNQTVSTPFDEKTLKRGPSRQK